MKELPFSPEIKPYKKPVEIGDTNEIYYDPDHPETLIRIPKDKEARFLKSDPKLIGITEKIYSRLDEMGRDLDIDVAPHQFILAKESSDGPVKPMLLTKRIDGSPLVPIDKNNPNTLESISRIAQLGIKYLNWIESNHPKSVVTDIFKPDQYITRPGETHDKLTLVDVEPRLKDRDGGVKFIDHEVGMLVGPLRDSAHDDVFRQYMQHALRSLKRDRNYGQMAGRINCIVNAPEIYQQISDDFLAGREIRTFSPEINNKLRNSRYDIDELLRKFGN